MNKTNKKPINKLISTINGLRSVTVVDRFEIDGICFFVSRDLNDDTMYRVFHEETGKHIMGKEKYPARFRIELKKAFSDKTLVFDEIKEAAKKHTKIN